MVESGHRFGRNIICPIGLGECSSAPKECCWASYSQHALWPEERFVDFQRPDPTIAASIGHHQEWIVGCKTGSETTCNFNYSGALTETVLLGNVAYRIGRRIRWNPANQTIPNAPEAESLLRREYREGWTL